MAKPRKVPSPYFSCNFPKSRALSSKFFLACLSASWTTIFAVLPSSAESNLTASTVCCTDSISAIFRSYSFIFSFNECSMPARFSSKARSFSSSSFSMLSAFSNMLSAFLRRSFNSWDWEFNCSSSIFSWSSLSFNFCFKASQSSLIAFESAASFCATFSRFFILILSSSNTLSCLFASDSCRLTSEILATMSISCVRTFFRRSSISSSFARKTTSL